MTAPEPDGQLRPDAGRTIARLQNRIGELTGQVAQYEDIVEQLQEQVATLTAELARAQQAPERTNPHTVIDAVADPDAA